IEEFVKWLIAAAGFFDDFLPGSALNAAATLELHNRLSRFVLKSSVLIESVLGFSIKTLQIGNMLCLRFAADLVQVGNQHSKLRPPIPNMVLPDNLMSLRFDRPA